MRASLARRTSSVLAIGAVAAASLLAAPQAAHAESLPTPVGEGTAWLLDQLTDGIVYSDQFGGFNDYSTTVDIALAMTATDQGPSAQGIYDAVAADVNGYITGGVWDPDSTYAGPVGKMLYFAQLMGTDGTDVGGVNLLTTAESLVDDTTGAANDDSPSNYANTISQVFVTRALAEAGNVESAKAIDWLLAHQCENGGFSLNIGQTATTCASNADADPDVTSFFLITFGDFTSYSPRIARAVGKAEGWLLSRQKADGSFVGGASTDYSNTNSTGLAGWALGDLDNTGAAEAAAIWLRGHQVQTVAGCGSALDGEIGAIAYDDGALATGRTEGIPGTAQYEWRLGTAQALPALRWAPEGASTPALSGPTAYVPTGGRATVRATGVTPGAWVCATGGVPGAADAAGAATLSAKVPTGATGTKTITLTVSDGTSATTTVKALSAKTLRPTVARATVGRGGSQTVVVTGLAAGEPVKVVYGGRTVRTGKASSTGRFSTSFAVGRSRGLKTVKVVGAFANRAGSKTFRVS